MTDECVKIDPTAFGLFFVALVSLPIAIACILGFMGVDNDIGRYLSGFLIIGGVFIFIAGVAAYKVNANFGFIVFSLVAAGVLFAGLYGGELYTNLTLGLIYLVALVWSMRICTAKCLTAILLTTALIFIFGGIQVETGEDVWLLMKGIAALANFALTLYLAYALVDDKLPVR